MSDACDLGPVLADMVDGDGPLRPVRVWPDRAGGPGALVVEATGADGRIVALTSVDGKITVASPDPRLPELDTWRSRPGTRLIAHRAGRRAVLAVAGGATTDDPTRYVKVARRDAADRAVGVLQAVGVRVAGVSGAPRLPEVLRHEGGVLVLAALPGRTVQQVVLAAAATGRLPDAERAGCAVGTAMVAFATAGGEAAGSTLPVHGLDDELGVLDRWVDDAVAHRVLRGDWLHRLRAAHQPVAEQLAALAPTAPVMAHRDLHDRQVLVDSRPRREAPDAAVAFLDLDTAAVADPGLDLGNLLAHLDLLAGAAGSGPGTRAAAAAFQRGLTDTIRGGGHPVLDDDPARVEVLRAASRVRLAAVHAFRPAAAGVVPGLLAPPVLPPYPSAS